MIFVLVSLLTSSDQQWCDKAGWRKPQHAQSLFVKYWETRHLREVSFPARFDSRCQECSWIESCLREVPRVVESHQQATFILHGSMWWTQNRHIQQEESNHDVLSERDQQSKEKDKNRCRLDESNHILCWNGSKVLYKELPKELLHLWRQIVWWIQGLHNVSWVSQSQV